MAISSFDNRSHKPDNKAVQTELGAASNLWSGLIQDICSLFPEVTEEWAFSSVAYGWSLRLIQKKKKILYLVPQKSKFIAVVVLNEKAVATANETSLPQEVIKELNDSPKYAEGRGIHIHVKSREDINAVESLVSIKVGHS